MNNEKDNNQQNQDNSSNKEVNNDSNQKVDPQKVISTTPKMIRESFNKIDPPKDDSNKDKK
jgi:hypothetical protein